MVLLVHRLLQTTSVPVKFPKKRQKAIAMNFISNGFSYGNLRGKSCSNLQANRNTINNASGGTLYQIYITGPF